MTAGDEFGEKLKIKETLSTVTDSQRKADSTIRLDLTLDLIAILSAMIPSSLLAVGWLSVKILSETFL